MATYTTNEAAEYVAPLTSDSGNVFCVYSEISLAGKSAGDVFELVNLPRGARVVEVLAKGTQDTQGGKISLGTNDDIDDIGEVNVDGNVAVVAPAISPLDDDKVFKGKLTAAGTSLGGTFMVRVFYTLTNIT